MLEQLIAAGDLIVDFDFKDGAAGGGVGEVNLDIRDSSFTRMRTVSTRHLKFFTKTRTNTLKCDFRYLPYVQGKINYCECQGVDVLSGYFSGCIMARYKKTGGSWRVCHVSTGEPNDCQAKWAQIKLTEIANPQSVVTEFKPGLLATGCDKVLGLITSIGGLYAIGCDRIQLEVPETRSEDAIFATLPLTSGVNERRQMAQYMARQKTRKLDGLRIKKIRER